MTPTKTLTATAHDRQRFAAGLSTWAEGLRKGEAINLWSTDADVLGAGAEALTRLDALLTAPPASPALEVEQARQALTDRVLAMVRGVAESVEMFGLADALIAAAVAHGRAELDHERHEKETVADAAKAHAEWARQERERLSATLSEQAKEIADLKAAIARAVPYGNEQCKRADALSATVTEQAKEIETLKAERWTCFHCGETFTTPGAARDHFGASEGAIAGCLIDRIALEEGGQPERGRGLLMALRKAEDRILEWAREFEGVENDARLWNESESERRRLQKGQDTSWFMFLDSLEGERLVLKERAVAAEAEVTRLSSLLAQREAAPGWQPIETAPKDGTAILGMWGTAEFTEMGVTRWVAGAWRDPYEIEELDDTFSEPARWMLLPSPPKGSDQ